MQPLGALPTPAPCHVYYSLMPVYILDTAAVGCAFTIALCITDGFQDVEIYMYNVVTPRPFKHIYIYEEWQSLMICIS
jgi:hypothetical protein